VMQHCAGNCSATANWCCATGYGRSLRFDF
jgi:hypothetical protein